MTSEPTLIFKYFAPATSEKFKVIVKANRVVKQKAVYVSREMYYQIHIHSTIYAKIHKSVAMFFVIRQLQAIRGYTVHSAPVYNTIFLLDLRT